MHKPIIFMFSGQGSHYFQMGKELFLQHPIFTYWMKQADKIYQHMTDLSIIETLYDDKYKKSVPFTRTILTHPAIFMVEHALGQVMLSENIKPKYVLGASLGEFAAAVFAGILSFETALIAVIQQAKFLEEQCLSGCMIAILSTLDFYSESSLLQKYSTLAAINFNSHFIISVKMQDVMKVEEHLTSQGITYHRLAVNHAFHSALIDPAEYLYKKHMKQQRLHPAHLALLSCAKASEFMTVPANHFWDCIRMPIQFQKTLSYLKNEDYLYVDLGPSGTLATFVKYNLDPTSNSQCFSIMSPFCDDNKKLSQTLKNLTS